MPNNGLVLYCGTIETNDGKEKSVTIDFEPFKPINTSLYLCDNKVAGGEGRLPDGSVPRRGAEGAAGGRPEVRLHRVGRCWRPVWHCFVWWCGEGGGLTMPQGQHSRGAAQVHRGSAEEARSWWPVGGAPRAFDLLSWLTPRQVRFARLRLEKRHNYLRKVAETATQMFIANDRPNVGGLVLAGSADFKNDLSASEMFDPRLSSKVIRIVDVSYGGENGFNQAIELSADALSNVKFVQEKKLIQKYFDEISQDTGRYCFGVDDTIKALDMGAVEMLLVWENLETIRYHLKVPSTGAEEVLYLRPEQETDAKYFLDVGVGARGPPTDVRRSRRRAPTRRFWKRLPW